MTAHRFAGPSSLDLKILYGDGSGGLLTGLLPRSAFDPHIRALEQTLTDLVGPDACPPGQMTRQRRRAAERDARKASK